MQQINLYQPLFRKQEKIFSARTMLQAGVIVIAGMILLLLFEVWQTQNLKQQVVKLQQQRDTNAAQVIKLSEQFPERKKDPALERDVARERKRIESRKAVMATLQQRTLGNLDGFASHLEGLARQRLSQLWLTRITIEQGGLALAIRGSTYQQEQLPQYLQQLSREQAFSGTEFKHLTMSRNEEQPQQLDFLVSSQPLQEARQ